MSTDGPFDPELVADVASQFDVDEDRLRRVVADHQASMAALPGVENLAYEWRKQYQDPLIERTDGAYYFSVSAGVWDEFASSLSLSAEELEALAAVHRTHLRERTKLDRDPPPQRTFVVLDRSAED